MSTSFVRDQPYLLKERIINLTLSELVICSLCHEVLWLPVACKNCETPFCSTCIKTWKIEASEPTRCPNPECLKEYIQRPCPRAVSLILSKLDVYCFYKSNGCPDTLPYNNLETHEENCNYGLKTCSGCKEKIIKMDFNKHYHQCPVVLLTCSECNSVYQRQNQHKHTEIVCVRVQLYKVRDERIENEQIQTNRLNHIESQMNTLIETIERLVKKKPNS